MPVNNLVSPSTSFVGREKELSDIAVLLADPHCRLVTLVGVGGIGKTRLALQVADDQQPHFTDGIVFVPFAPVGSPELIPAAIAGALDISFYGSEEPRTQLLSYFHEKQMLLVMDNFEHLLEGVDLLSDLLQAARHLKILVTSRSRLSLQEEWLFSLDGLSFSTESSTDALENYSAVQLFVQRARQVSSPFTLKENAAHVRAICRQVEGMPLGLELAATWLRAMTCQQVVEQMERNLDFLTTSLRNIPERHRSLRLVFDQSWQLLSDEEQSVLMKLSVFRGGFDLEGAQDVAQASPSILAQLVDQSLIRLDKNGRYDIHELLRQYAAEKLALNGDVDNVAQCHLGYFIKFADQAESHLFSSQQIVWFDRLEVEMDNFRTAFAYAADSESGLRLAVALGWFFSECSYWKEGLGWFERTLTANPNAPAALRAKAFHLAGGLAGHFGDEARLHSYCQQSIEIAKATDNQTAIAWSLCHLGFYFDHDLEEAALQLRESVKLFREIGNSMGMAHCLNRLAWNAIASKDLTLARTYVDEAALLSNQANDTIMLAWTNYTLGKIVRYNHEFEEAIKFFKHSVAYFREGHLPDGVNLALMELASVVLKVGDLNNAELMYKDALRLPRGNMLNHPCVPVVSAGLAHIALLRRQYERSAILLAIAEVDWLINDSKHDPEFQPYVQDILTVRSHLGEAAFEAAWATGKAMNLKQAENYALQEKQNLDITPLQLQHRSSESGYAQSLTEREIEILRLMSDGLNSTEIANRLILSSETIRWYQKQIYSKLDVHSRSEAIARAKQLNLLT